MADKPAKLSKDERKIRSNLAKSSRDVTGEMIKQVKVGDQLDKILGNIFQNENKIAKLNKDLEESKGKQTTDQIKQKQLDVDAVKASQTVKESINARLAGFRMMIAKAKLFNMFAKANPYVALAAIIIAIGVAFVKFQKAVAETRKDLGIGAIEAASMNVAFKGLAFAGKAFGLESEDIKESFKAAKDNLGASRGEALGLSLNLAKVALETGTTADQLTSVLSVMESVSSASQEALLAQIEINRQLAGDAGVAPADVFRDIAENAEFFAQFAKSGSNNLVQAGIAARKLGLNMSSVVGITESLLDFETSIEKQMEASVLLGRNINLDKARQLALAGKQDQMMGEILKQVGGEAEFNKMNVIQRKALAESVGVNVEQLSRLVRNNTAGGTAGAVNSAMGSQGQMQERMLSGTEKIAKSNQEIRDTIVNK
tara:strand:- start:24 stop:1307 length:1284 start_codon:yes stop_codon:yes gene_type:complete